MSALVVLVPVLRRPGHVAPLLESVRAATPEPFRVLFLPNPHDHAEREAIAEAGAQELPLDGNYAKKINRAIPQTRESLIFLGADDLSWHPGWLEAARAELTDEIGCVGTQDNCNPRVIRGEHATHFLLARWYAMRPTIDGKRGPLYEGYAHNAVDDELIGTAKHRGAYAFAPRSIVEHRHPLFGTAEMDSTYRRGQASLTRDKRTLRRRSHLWTT